MRTKTLLCLVALLSVFVLASCEKKIVPKDIYGHWKLQNDVMFTGDKAFTLLEFNEDTIGDWDSWIDPVINDSIYHFSSVSVVGRDLVLVADNGHTEKYKIKELHDSVLVIADFPGANKDLYFKNLTPEPKPIIENGDTLHPFPVSYNIRVKASDLSKDSLDINIKSTYFFKYNFYPEHFALSKTQFQLARSIIKQYMDNKEYLKKECYNLPNSEVPAPLDNYIRQYAGHIEDGKLYACIRFCEFFGVYSPFIYMNLKMDIPNSSGGGVSILWAKIDLSEKKVVEFYDGGLF